MTSDTLESTTSNFWIRIFRHLQAALTSKKKRQLDWQLLKKSRPMRRLTMLHQWLLLPHQPPLPQPHWPPAARPFPMTNPTI